jgi:hypothetical protein
MWWEMFHAQARFGGSPPKPAVVNAGNVGKSWFGVLTEQGSSRPELACWDCVSNNGEVLVDSKCGPGLTYLYEGGSYDSRRNTRSELVRGFIRKKSVIEEWMSTGLDRDGVRIGCGKYRLTHKDSAYSWRLALALERNGHTAQYRPTGDNYEPEFRWAPVAAVPTRRCGRRVSGGAAVAVETSALYRICPIFVWVRRRYCYLYRPAIHASCHSPIASCQPVQADACTPDFRRSALLLPPEGGGGADGGREGDGKGGGEGGAGPTVFLD